MINLSAADADPTGSYLNQNLQMMSQTVFSGADPAIADLAGTAGIIRGTDPTGYIGQLTQSWFGTPSGGAPGAANGTPMEGAMAEPSVLVKGGLMVLAIGLVLIGAMALVMPGAMRAAEG